METPTPIDNLTENPDLLLMDGFDDCIAGIVERYGEEDIICYDRDAVWDKLGKMGMSCEDAVEFYYFNQLGAYMGERTPCFVYQP